MSFKASKMNATSGGYHTVTNIPASRVLIVDLMCVDTFCNFICKTPFN